MTRNKINFTKLTQNLSIEMDIIMCTILTNLADYYPMAAPTGGTSRMRDAIHEINRTDD